MSRGVVIFGMNNARIDYVQLAIMCAGFVRKNMPGTRVCLITDQASKNFQDGKPGQRTSLFFDDIIIAPYQVEKFSDNKRHYRDTQYYGFDEKFRNETRSSAYDLSPYDETLLIDCDFLVCSDVLSNCWRSEEEVMINRKAIDLHHQQLGGTEERLNPFGIPMYWATVIYFRKGEKAERLFRLVEHIKDNWDFYKLTYDFPNPTFRNDYAFSIAIHILNGFFEESSFVVPLPEPEILTAMDTDQFYGISSPNELHFFTPDRKESWRFLGTRLKGINVHCMNKLSLLNNADEIMEVLR